MVTVIFSHHGSTDSPGVLASVGAAVARISGTIGRSTLQSPPAPAPAPKLTPPPLSNARNQPWRTRLPLEAEDRMVWGVERRANPAGARKKYGPRFGGWQKA